MIHTTFRTNKPDFSQPALSVQDHYIKLNRNVNRAKQLFSLRLFFFFLVRIYFTQVSPVVSIYCTPTSRKQSQLSFFSIAIDGLCPWVPVQQWFHAEVFFYIYTSIKSCNEAYKCMWAEELLNQKVEGLSLELKLGYNTKTITFL